EFWVTFPYNPSLGAGLREVLARVVRCVTSSGVSHLCCRSFRPGHAFPWAGSNQRKPHATCSGAARQPSDRKSTRLNSSHVAISYAVFCLKKKKNKKKNRRDTATKTKQISHYQQAMH